MRAFPNTPHIPYHGGTEPTQEDTVQGNRGKRPNGHSTDRTHRREGQVRRDQGWEGHPWEGRASENHAWQGRVPPQYVYSHLAFRGVALDPPDFEPGSWIGAGRALRDPETGGFLLTARPRWVKNDDRGFAANIYRSPDGEGFSLAYSLTKREAAEASGLAIHSIEGTQLLLDPLTGSWHLYLSVDTGDAFVWGGVKWETLLLSSPEITGPWKSAGIVLGNDQPYDVHQARDSTIEILDGRWVCLYKAKDAQDIERPALAVSVDGIHWNKRGILTVDGESRRAFLSGSLFAAGGGPMFLGIETQLRDTTEARADVVYADEHKIGHGGGSVPHFCGYALDQRGRNLETIFRAPWQPGSEYEHPEHPLLGYSSSVYDEKNRRLLMYVEAIDAKLSRAIGLNETVERVLVYEARI